MKLNLNLLCSPQWKNVANIRNFVMEMLSSGIVTLDDAKKVATVISELIENIVKYSAISGTDISLGESNTSNTISLTLSNITTIENIKAFESFFSLINTGAPKDVYKNMMLRSFSDPDKSQLGLARIQYECQGELSYAVSENLMPIIENDEDIPNKENLRKLSITVNIPVQQIH